MNSLLSACCAAAALTLTATAAYAQPPARDAVPVFDSTQIAFDSYTVLHRMGVQDWRSAFGIGGYTDEPSARRALLTQAASLGADGIVNLQCLNQTDRIFKPSGYYCYGNAIRLKNERRLAAAAGH
jgi:hypothetical protein